MIFLLTYAGRAILITSAIRLRHANHPLPPLRLFHIATWGPGVLVAAPRQIPVIAEMVHKATPMILIVGVAHAPQLHIQDIHVLTIIAIRDTLVFQALA